jgi:hypothetical protein
VTLLGGEPNFQRSCRARQSPKRGNPSLQNLIRSAEQEAKHDDRGEHEPTVESAGNMNGPPAAVARPWFPSPRHKTHTQTLASHADPPLEPAGTARISLLGRGPRPPGCEPDTMRADHRCQGTSGPAGSAGMSLAAQARRHPPRPESIRARCRRTRVGRGRDSALSGPSPGARGVSG